MQRTNFPSSFGGHGMERRKKDMGFFRTQSGIIVTICCVNLFFFQTKEWATDIHKNLSFVAHTSMVTRRALYASIKSSRQHNQGVSGTQATEFIIVSVNDACRITHTDELIC
jgi:hypothetical protein